MGSLLMSLESVFAVIGGWMLQGDAMSGIQILGCAVIFVAILIVQIQIPKISENKKS